ncbi:MAG: PepSY-like domain-containing protein [Muribaculaceae bacterium]|nr:PepSY-like domain-containing protein [Muribaculaceae bacterium]
MAYVENDHDHGSLAYELTLNDGTEVDFYADNQWDKVDCHTKAVPAALVPNAVAAYVNANYKGMTITKIDKEHGGFEVELNNGIDLNFSASGQFLGVDD